MIPPENRALIKKPDPLPPGLRELFNNHAIRLETYLARREFANSFSVAMSLYEVLLSSQPPNSWYHKGYALHNAGLSVLLQDKAEEAYRLFFMAFIEDALAEASGEDVEPEDKPAGLVLRFIYSLEEGIVRRAIAEIRRVAKETGLVRDPAEVLRRIGAPAPPKVKVEARRRPGQYDNPWGMRVFIGGNHDMLASINAIRQVVVDLGFEPIIAREFDIPPDLMHHHSLMLLHDCKYAIFEVSKEGGQLMEIERTRDYEVETLAVHQMENFHASAMVRALLDRQGVQVVSYHDVNELPAIVREFLKDRGDGK